MPWFRAEFLTEGIKATKKPLREPTIYLHLLHIELSSNNKIISISLPNKTPVTQARISRLSLPDKAVALLPLEDRVLESEEIDCELYIILVLLVISYKPQLIYYF